MVLKEYFPFWGKLTDSQQERLQGAVQERRFEKNSMIYDGSEGCLGLLLPTGGQLRIFILSDEGKEITLYRLFERDMCLFSASCILRGIQFEVMVEAEQDSTILYIPSDVYKALMEESAAVANYTNELMAARFSDVMWLIDQVLNKKLDTRLAAFLIEESRLTGTTELTLTHERIAHHLGSAREVVTRMLKYFQNEQLVKLTRGSVTLRDLTGLENLAAASLR